MTTPAIDVWVASAPVSEADESPAHLVPLSLAWVDGRVVIALQADSRTARNIGQSGSARLGLGPTRDVVLIDAVLEQVVDVLSAPVELTDGYARQADWDPRSSPDGYVYVVLRPRRIQAWREANEIAGRTLMRDGAWIV